MHSEGKVAKQTGPKAFYARVWVECAPSGGESSPPVCVLDADAGAVWKDAAVAGATWALEVAGIRATCTVIRIHWMPLDSNPTLVAIAAARAVWASLQFTPDDEVAARLEESIISSHEIDDGRVGLP